YIIRNALDGEPVFRRYAGVGHACNVVFEKIDNACVGKLHAGSSALLGSVGHVVTERTSGMMGGIYASRVGARIKDMHPIRDLPIRMFVGKPMGKLLRSRPAGSKKAVSFIVPVSMPLPAVALGFYGNLGPESMIKHSL